MYKPVHLAIENHDDNNFKKKKILIVNVTLIKKNAANFILNTYFINTFTSNFMVFQKDYHKLSNLYVKCSEHGEVFNTCMILLNKSL